MASPVYYSCDSHVVEAPEVFDGLAERFGERGPRVVEGWKEREGVFVAWPFDRLRDVGRAAGDRGREPEPAGDQGEDEARLGADQPRRARPRRPALGAGDGRDRG